MDLSKTFVRTVSSSENRFNIKIQEETGLNGRTGYWIMSFTFDYCLENDVKVRLTNMKHKSEKEMWTMEVLKCTYLGIASESQLVSFDVADELMDTQRLSTLVGSDAFMETKLKYIEQYVVPLVTKKIKYTKFKPQFNPFLSYKWNDAAVMVSLQNGLRFLGYNTWMDKNDMPLGAQLQPALKVAIDRCDCLVAWLNEEYMTSDYCKAELLYAKKCGKIIICFGEYETVEKHFKSDFEFLRGLHIFDPKKSPSFYEILCRLDDALFNFEKLPF